MTDIVVIDDLVFSETITTSLANRIRDSAVTSEDVNPSGSSFHMVLAETAAPTETVSGIRTAIVNLTDNATSAEAASFLRAKEVSDPATTADAVTTTNRTTVTVVDNATTSESVRGALTAVITDSATTAETLTLNRPLTVIDNATTSDSNSNTRQVTATVTDNAATNDSETPIAAAHASDSSTTSDAVVDVQIRATTISDAATPSETIVAGAHRVEEVVDNATTSDAITANMHATSTIVDTAETAEAVGTSSDAWTGFWQNTHTAAPALWTGLPFNSMVEVDGVLYGAGPDGLYRMADGIDDDGTRKRAEVLWDLEDMGSPQRKRLDGIYVQGSSKKPFTVTVTNKQGRFSYRTTPASNEIAQHRAQPGQGLETSHYRIGVVQNDEFGADFVQVACRQVARRV